MAHQIRPATIADLNDINELVNSAYRGESSRVGWTTEADFLDGQRTDLETLQTELQTGHILCLFSDSEQLLGCVYLRAETSDTWYLGMLTIDPRKQSAGLGRELLEAAEEYSRQHGGRFIIMNVVQLRHSLIAWYERRGYKATGLTQPFPYGNDRFGIPQRSDLHFVQFKKEIRNK